VLYSNQLNYLLRYYNTSVLQTHISGCSWKVLVQRQLKHEALLMYYSHCHDFYLLQTFAAVCITLFWVHYKTAHKNPPTSLRFSMLDPCPPFQIIHTHFPHTTEKKALAFRSTCSPHNFLNHVLLWYYLQVAAWNLCVVHASMFAEAMAHSMKVYKLFMGADGLSNYSTWPRTFQINIVNVGFYQT